MVDMVWFLFSSVSENSSFFSVFECVLWWVSSGVVVGFSMMKLVFVFGMKLLMWFF